MIHATYLSVLWHQLVQTPLLWLTITLAVFHAATRFYYAIGSKPLLHPLILSIAMIVPLLIATDTPYDVYFNSTQCIHFLLGPATVALAIPLYLYAARVKELLLPVIIALIVGSLTGILSAVFIAQLAGGSDVLLRSLAPKSVTTPIAMGVAQKIGGIPSLTAVLVIVTGAIGAMGGSQVLDALGIREAAARGFALGLSSHGLGTARALQMGEEEGAFSGLGMGLNGALTAVIVPIIASLLF